MKKHHISYILGLIWGVIWALFLQYTRLGQFLAIRRTWLTVVVGIGIDLLIMRPVIPWQSWERVFLIISYSSIGIIIRSLYNEFTGKVQEINDVEHNARA